jgi:cytidine deaminase
MADPDVDEMFRAAVAAQAKAYVPYSHFHVGASIVTTTGALFAACNVENAAYPSSVCAEAGAISTMVSAGEREIAAILTVCDGELLGTPCGSCRQRIREFAVPGALIHVASAAGVQRTFTIDELLPASFGPEHLGVR